MRGVPHWSEELPVQMKTDTNAISTHRLVKRYGKLTALHGIDLRVSVGQFVGLLGPNGAGKTTTINILSGLSNKTSGDVSLFGYDVIKSYRECRRRVGLVPQEFNFDLFAKVRKILQFQGGYFGIGKAECSRRALALMEQFDLTEKQNTPARYLSGGMKRRLMIARALMHAPRLLILDEPTAGVDVDLRRSLWSFLGEVNKSGTTILLTTHYIEEAEALCDHIAIINQGRIIDQDTTQNMSNRLSHESIVVTASRKISGEAIRSLADLDPQSGADGHALTLTFHRDTVPYESVLQRVLASGIGVANIQPADNRLEQVFLHLTKSGNQQ